MKYTIEVERYPGDKFTFDTWPFGGTGEQNGLPRQPHDWFVSAVVNGKEYTDLNKLDKGVGARICRVLERLLCDSVGIWHLSKVPGTSFYYVFVPHSSGSTCYKLYDPEKSLYPKSNWKQFKKIGAREEWEAAQKMIEDWYTED